MILDGVGRQRGDEDMPIARVDHLGRAGADRARVDVADWHGTGGRRVAYVRLVAQRWVAAVKRQASVVQHGVLAQVAGERARIDVLDETSRARVTRPVREPKLGAVSAIIGEEIGPILGGGGQREDGRVLDAIAGPRLDVVDAVGASGGPVAPPELAPGRRVAAIEKQLRGRRAKRGRGKPGQRLVGHDRRRARCSAVAPPQRPDVLGAGRGDEVERPVHQSKFGREPGVGGGQIEHEPRAGDRPVRLP